MKRILLFVCTLMLSSFSVVFAQQTDMELPDSPEAGTVFTFGHFEMD